MHDIAIDSLLKRFHRSLLALRLLRGALFAQFFVVMFGALVVSIPWFESVAFGLLLASAALWVGLTVWSTRRAQAVHIASVMVAAGEFEPAVALLAQAMGRFTILRSVKLSAGLQLAVIANRTAEHATAVRLCQALLQHRLDPPMWLATQCRLILADSLLALDRSAEAYSAFRPVYERPLSLAERLTVLPIALRYELACGHTDSAVRALPEKVRLAELLDAAKAALVHALLAEACRRKQLDRAADATGDLPAGTFHAYAVYLARRAAVYHDLDEVARKHPLIAPVVEYAAR